MASNNNTAASDTKKKKKTWYTSLRTESSADVDEHEDESSLPANVRSGNNRHDALHFSDELGPAELSANETPGRSVGRQRLRRRSVVRQSADDGQVGDTEMVHYEQEDALPTTTQQTQDLANADNAAAGTATAAQQHHQQHHRIPPAVYLFAACAAWNSCILGYDFGVNTLSALLVQEALELSDVQLESYLGALDLFAMLGAAVASTVNDRYGRRGAFCATSVGFIAGALLQATAQSYAWLFVGRALVGIAIGVGLAIDPIYISEMAPADRRGELVSWSEIAINIGVVLGFASGVVFYHVPDAYAWRFMFGTGALLPVPMLFLIRYVMPESPRYLVQKHREDEAVQVLLRVYDNNEEEVHEVVEEIKDSLEQEQRAQELGWKFLLCEPTPAYRRMLWAGILAGVSQQVVGISGIGNFLAYIMDRAGLKNRLHQALALMTLQSIKTAVTVGASQVIDTMGRRPLCFISLAGMTVSLIFLSADFALTSATSGLAFLGLLGYLGFFGVGMGPCAWLIPSEIFTTSIRASAMSMATFVNRLASTTMASTFLSLEKAITWSGVFAFLAVLCVIMAALIYVYVPETKGKTLEEMAAFFASITGDTTILDTEASMAAPKNTTSNHIDRHLSTNLSADSGAAKMTTSSVETTIEMRTIV